MNTQDKRLIGDHNFENQLDQAIARALVDVIQPLLPCSTAELPRLFKSYGVNFRFDFYRGGADINIGRINVYTNGKGIATKLTLG